jgi:hypothetical protein
MLSIQSVYWCCLYSLCTDVYAVCVLMLSIQSVYWCCLYSLCTDVSMTSRHIHIAPTLPPPPGRTLSKLEKHNFSGEPKNRWPVRSNRINRTTTLLPSRGHFGKWTCDASPLGRYGLRHTSCRHNSKWAFFELWECFYRGAICNIILTLSLPN